MTGWAAHRRRGGTARVTSRFQSARFRVRSAVDRVRSRIRIPRRVREVAMALGATLFGVYVGRAVMSDAPRVLLGSFGALVLATATLFPRFFPWVFRLSIGVLLGGYAFLGRAFAHVGLPPIYIGDIVLATGLMALVSTPRRWAAFRSPIAWCYLAFAAWGALRAVPYLPVYGLDVLRDTAIWAYGAFALLVPAFVAGPRSLSTIFDRYSKWMPLVVVWFPIGLVVGRMFPHLLPVAEESGQSMELIKPSAAGVHVAGGAVFLLLGLHQISGRQRVKGLLGAQWFLMAAFLMAFVSIGVLGRGGALAVLVPLLLLMAVRPLIALPKLLMVGITAVTGLLVLLASNFSIELGRRDLSAHQLTSNLMSIVGDAPEDEKNLEQTADWRIRWWTKIVDYTVFGPYFWTGKGFGVNLAEDDGIKKEAYNRSPHSAHMTVLARMGVPGEMLWILLQGTFGLSLAAAYVRARRRGRDWWARLDLWILSYWLAFLVAMSFGVYIEGPYGGIWFWSLIGFGIAILQAQDPPAERPAARAYIGERHEVRARAQLLSAAGR